MAKIVETKAEIAITVISFNQPILYFRDSIIKQIIIIVITNNLTSVACRLAILFSNVILSIYTTSSFEVHHPCAYDK